TPAQPGSLSATAVSSTQINLTWLDKAINETSYSVERSLNGSTWSVIATLPSNSTSYADTGLNGGSEYYYRVRAFDGSLASNYSTSVNASAPATARAMSLAGGLAFRPGPSAGPAGSGGESQGAAFGGGKASLVHSFSSGASVTGDTGKASFTGTEGHTLGALSVSDLDDFFAFHSFAKMPSWFLAKPF